MTTPEQQAHIDALTKAYMNYIEARKQASIALIAAYRKSVHDALYDMILKPAMSRVIQRITSKPAKRGPQGDIEAWKRRGYRRK